MQGAALASVEPAEMHAGACLVVNVLCSYYVVLPLSLLPEGLWRRLGHVTWPRHTPDVLAVLARMRSTFAALPPHALLVRSLLMSMLLP